MFGRIQNTLKISNINVPVGIATTVTNIFNTVKILQKLKIIENKTNIPPFPPPPPPLAGLVGPKPDCPPPDKLALLNSG